MIEERKEKHGVQSEEQINIQEILFRYLIHWPWFDNNLYCLCLGIFAFDNTHLQCFCHRLNEGGKKGWGSKRIF